MESHEDTIQDLTARRLIDEALSDDTPTTTFYRDTTPPQPTGAQPVTPPDSRPPMSQRAADISGIIAATGIASLPAGGGIALACWGLSSVDPAVVAMVAAAPVALVGAVAVAARAIGQAARDAAEAMPPGEVHHHHTGPTVVQHTEVRTVTRGLGRTTNQLPGSDRR